MPAIGAHLPIGKGLKNTADEATDKGLETLQVFLRNPRGRGARKLSEEEVSYFRQMTSKHNISPIVVHIPYICNPASVKEDLYEFALQTVKHDLERCDLVGADYLVLHPGAFTGSTLEKGIVRVSKLLNLVLERYSGSTMILLETMSGQGTEIGKEFDELHQIMQNIDKKEKVGICYDTCHTYAAGYDCTNPDGIKRILDEMDRTFGREKVKVIHANDSSKELGSRRDRHAHIGEGFIGEAGFKELVGHEFFRRLPFILETPVEGIDKDIETLHRLRK